VPELEFEIGAGAYVPFTGDLTTVADVLMQACKNLNLNQARAPGEGGGAARGVGGCPAAMRCLPVQGKRCTQARPPCAPWHALLKHPRAVWVQAERRAADADTAGKIDAFIEVSWSM
jgi:hypothetical protein